MSDKDSKSRTTRREFIELALTTTAVGLTQGGRAEAATPPASRPEGRAHYRIFSPGRIGKMKLKNRIVRTAAFEGAGAIWGRRSSGRECLRQTVALSAFGGGAIIPAQRPLDRLIRKPAKE